jgi:Transcriptional regulator, AbiEi antitoxin
MADEYAAHAQDWPADLQAGVLTRPQALAAGLTDSAITNRLRSGRWQRLYPGVYATFSGTLVPECHLWAAILRAGPSSALSHQTAARLWELSGASTPAIHVTVPRGSPVASMPGVVIHYAQRVTQARHPTALPPRTTVEETALDLAGAARSAEDAVAWVLRAVASRRTTAERLSAALRQRRRIRWRSEIGYALDPVNAGVHSILEFRFVNRVERPHGLPPGTRQRPARRGLRHEYADTAYEEYATLVELDGRAAHPESSRHLDTNRDNANIADGWVTLRYGWIEVSERSCEVAAQLAQALRCRGWTGPTRRCSARCRIPPADAPTRPASAQPSPPRPASAPARPASAPARPASALPRPASAPPRLAPARPTLAPARPGPPKGGLRRIE